MKVRQGYKTFHTYKNILVHRAEDGVNFCFLDITQLHHLIARCQEAHPKDVVWYQIIETEKLKGNNYNAKVRIIYRPKFTVNF